MNTAINVTANVLLSILLVIGGLLVALWIFLAFHSPRPQAECVSVLPSVQSNAICNLPNLWQAQTVQSGEPVDPRTGLQAPLLPGGETTVTGQF